MTKPNEKKEEAAKVSEEAVVEAAKKEAERLAREEAATKRFSTTGKSFSIAELNARHRKVLDEERAEINEAAHKAKAAIDAVLKPTGPRNVVNKNASEAVKEAAKLSKLPQAAKPVTPGPVKPKAAAGKA